MDSPKISIIVPIYNVQQYLEPCLDSLVDQTLDSLEIIMINDGSTDKSGDIMRKYAEEYANFFAYDKPNGGLGQARNFGVKFAKGKYIAFVDSDDIVVFDAYEKMFATAEQTGSDIVVGNVMRFNSRKVYPSTLHQKIFSRKKLKAHISRDHELIYDTTAWNKLFRKSFWDENHLVFPEHMLYEDIPVTIPAHYLAHSVDVLDDIVYYWRSRDFGDQSITQDRTDIHNLEDRLKAVSMVNDFFTEQHITGSLLAEKDYKLLNTDLLIYLNKLTEAGDQYVDLYFKWVTQYLKDVPEEGIQKLWPIDRMKYYFVKKADKEKVFALLRFQKSGALARTKLERKNGHYYAVYPYRSLVPDQLLIIDQNLQVKYQTRMAEWQGKTLNISGYAYIQQVRAAHKWNVKMKFALVNEENGERIGISQYQVKRNIANTIRHGVWARKKFLPFLFVNNYNWSDINLSIPFDSEEFRKIPLGHYRIEGNVQTGGIERSFILGAPVKGKKARPDSLMFSRSAIHLDYGNNWDLHIIKDEMNHILENADVSNSELCLSGLIRDSEAIKSIALKKWRTGSYLHFPVTVKNSDFNCAIPLKTFESDNGFGGYDVFLESGKGEYNPLFQPERRKSKIDGGFAEIDVSTSRLGYFYLIVRQQKAELSEIKNSGQTIKMEFAAPFSFNSASPQVRLELLSDDHNEALFLPLETNLVRDKYGRVLYQGVFDSTGSLGTELLRHQTFSLFMIAGEDSEIKYQVLIDDLSKRNIEIDKKNYHFWQKSDKTANLSISAKWAWIERGRLRRAVLKRLAYPAARLLPLKKKTILFESYWGRSYECNPRALYEYIDKNYPEFETVWGLNNPLTHIKGHAKIVRRYSLRYYYYLARAKYFVNNVNFPAFARKRKGTVELQTMHGTPLKTLGLDAPGEVKPGEMAEYLVKNRRWDYLCVPSDYVAGIAAGAFKHRAEIIRSGYPRNDKLFQDNKPDKVLEIKKRLGIPTDKKVIFYAPTWRVENYFKLELDIKRLKKAVGKDYILLLKFHHYVASSVQIDYSNVDNFVFNESDYDDIRDLYLIADILITDYSSVMFDFAILNRPILFFTYDLDNYRDHLRGMYFDLVKEAPGPLCMTNDDLIRELKEIDDYRDKYGKKLDAFRSKFNTYDHGNACKQCFDEVFRGKN